MVHGLKQCPWGDLAGEKPLIKISPNSLTEGSFLRGTQWTIFENQSTMVRITVLPAEEGRPVIKSMAKWDHGHEGIGRGCSKPVGVGGGGASGSLGLVTMKAGTDIVFHVLY